MTDDEIDAILRPELESYQLTVIECERIAFRAGMLRAAQIARSLNEMTVTSYNSYGGAGGGDVPSDDIERAATAIECAASDEPPAA